MRYHDNNEGCVGILETINHGPISDLSNHAGLSSWQLNNCLALLQKNLLIEYEEGSQIYRITKKGIQYLYYYKKIIESLSFKTRKKEEILA